MVRLMIGWVEDRMTVRLKGRTRQWYFGEIYQIEVTHIIRKSTFKDQKVEKLLNSLFLNLTKQVLVSDPKWNKTLFAIFLNAYFNPHKS